MIRFSICIQDENSFAVKIKNAVTIGKKNFIAAIASPIINLTGDVVMSFFSANIRFALLPDDTAIQTHEVRWQFSPTFLAAEFPNKLPVGARTNLPNHIQFEMI